MTVKTRVSKRTASAHQKAIQEDRKKKKKKRKKRKKKKKRKRKRKKKKRTSPKEGEAVAKPTTQVPFLT
jgi:hypothetical protein